MSVEEFLRFQESVEERYEYVDGYAYPIAGANRRHGRIVTNVTVRLALAARNGPCSVFQQHLLVRTPRSRFYYPDVLVLCTGADDDTSVVDDPCLAVEVTSRSTGRIDRGEKRESYFDIPALRTYLIVEQGKRWVTHFWRDDAGVWQQEALIGEGSIAVPCPRTTLTLDEIYQGVDLTVAERDPEEYEVEV